MPHVDLHLSDIQFLCIFVSISGAMILTAESLRYTSRLCEFDEAMRRLRWSIGLFRTAPLLLILFGANQTVTVVKLKEVALSRGVDPIALRVAAAEQVSDYEVELKGGTYVSWSRINGTTSPLCVRAGTGRPSGNGDGGEIGRTADSGRGSGDLRRVSGWIGQTEY